MDSNSKMRLVVDSTHVIIWKEKNEGFSQYLSTFMAIAYFVLNNQQPPNIFPEAKEILQHNTHMRLGDWYLFEDYR